MLQWLTKMPKFLFIFVIFSLHEIECKIIADGKEPGCLTIVCKNGGTLIPDTCTCSCSPSFTGHFCDQELKPTQWPLGSYSLPPATFGCPETELYGWTRSFLNLSMTTKIISQTWNDNEKLTLEPHILGPYFKYDFQLNFCTKKTRLIDNASMPTDNSSRSTDNASMSMDNTSMSIGNTSRPVHNGSRPIDNASSSFKWEPGNYCIYRGNRCPEGFEDGNFTMAGYRVTNQAGNVSSADIGDNSTITLHFCCRDDRNETIEIKLPTSMPFNLFKGYSAASCQEVEDMDVTEDVFYMADEHQTWTFVPPHPHVDLNVTSHVGVSYCYYHPKERRECYYDVDGGFSYNGYTNTTISGQPCLIWNEVDDRYINRKVFIGEFEENYCRRDKTLFGSDNDRPYCFVNMNKDEEICNISVCAEEEDLSIVEPKKPVYHPPINEENYGDYAVDGIIDSNVFTNYRPYRKPWFVIDMQEYYEVHAILVYRYKTWYSFAFRGVGTYVSKHQWDFLFYGAVRCEDLRFPGKAFKYRFQCRRPITGQFVIIRNLDFTDLYQRKHVFLSFAEVKILGKRTMCGRPFGLTTGDIRDFQIESSSASMEYLSEFGTLYRSGNGWCSDPNDIDPWIMVDLIIPQVVQGVLIQGWTEGQSSKFIRSFSVAYGMNVSSLLVYQDVQGIDKIFHTNENLPVEMPQRYVFWTEFVTRYVKLNIKSFDVQTCLKLEIFGCPKRGVRDFKCTDNSTDLGFEYLNYHEYWQELLNASYRIDNPKSLSQCIEFCKSVNCASVSGSNIHCVFHFVHRYNIHFVFGWVFKSQSHSFALQRLCFEGFYEMSDCGFVKYLEGNNTLFIQSPGYPLHYGQGMDCVWIIKAQNQNYVSLEFVDITIPSTVTTAEFKENRFFDSHPGHCKDKVIISSSNKGNVTLTSDNAKKYIGSIIKSSEREIKIQLVSCFHYKKIELQNFIFKVKQEEVPGCGMDVEGCRGFCTKQAAFIASPRFPAIYDNNEICNWEIVGVLGQYIRFEFYSIDIPELDDTCSQSYVALYDVALNEDTSLIGRYCFNNHIYEPVLSSWHKMKLEFRSEFTERKGYGFLGKYQLVNFTQDYGNVKDKGCGENWYSHQQRCYKLFTWNTTLTWRDALTRCHDNDGHLLSISDGSEMKFIHYLMTNIWKQNDAYIGLTKTGTEDKLQNYVWSDGSPLTFTAWFKDPLTTVSQPDGLVNEKCTTIQLYSIHTMDNWHDVPCAYDKLKNFVCEKRAPYAIDETRYASDMVRGITQTPTNLTELSHVFVCNNTEMISSAYVCDGDIDCSDGSDEFACGTDCTDNQFQCTNRMCISVSLYCDFRQDCEDASDETNCVPPACSAYQWTCDNKQCIHKDQRCDLKYDCFDKSDEESCDNCDNFQCYDTKCISSSRVCDGQIDCNGKYSEDENQECTTGVKSSCSEWYAVGVRTNGEYQVSLGLKYHLKVECRFEETEKGTDIFTVVHYAQEKTLTAYHSEIHENIEYFASPYQIHRLMKTSTCTQSIKLDCKFTLLNVWWWSYFGDGTDGYGLRHTRASTNCSCPFAGKCDPELERCNCNKFKTDWFLYDQNTVLTDEGVITNHDLLPIGGVYAENPRSDHEFYKLILGPLVCKEATANINSDILLCKSGITVKSDVKCVLDFDVFGEIKGCRDLSHLDNCEHYVCPPGHAKCHSSYCIPVRFMCDGIKHCRDGEDEMGCDQNGGYSCPGFFHCHRSPVCLSSDQICDNIRQCQEADDEHLCNIRCPSSCLCDDLMVICKRGKIEKVVLNQIEPNIRKLDMSYSEVVIESEMLYKFKFLGELNMSNCGIFEIPQNMFIHSNNLFSLDLSYNRITQLLTNAFIGLSNLQFLLLEGNRFTFLSRFAFNGLSKLSVIHISGSQIGSLLENSFFGLQALRDLNMTGDDIGQIGDLTFTNLSKLVTLDLRLNRIRDFSKDIFKGLTSLQNLFTDEYVFCCLRPSSVKPENCLPQPDEFSSCSDLMRIDLLRYCLWIIGLCAFVGNIFVLVYRMLDYKNMSTRSHSFLVFNLSLSDLLMGLYLLIIAGADSYYRGRYIWNDYSWRNSILCETAGVLSTISSEGSVLFIALITVDRFIAVKFPFGQIKFTARQSKIACVLVWVFSMVTAVIPVFPIGYFHGFYSRSAVCLALPLTRNRPAGWEFSTTVFIFVNLVLFTFIAIGQLMIYREVVTADKKIKSQRRSQDLAVARSLFLVVFTDFLCWFPLGVMGLAALSGRVIPGEVYAWSAVFVLPINSALNPFLYTFSAIWKQKRTSDPSKKFSLRNGAAAGSMIPEDVCTNDQLIIGNRALHMKTLQDFCNRNYFTVADIHIIALRCADALKFLHDRSIYHGDISENVVFPLLEDNKIVNVKLQITPKLAKENMDIPTDMCDYGSLIKQLLRLNQARKRKDK